VVGPGQQDFQELIQMHTQELSYRLHIFSFFTEVCFVLSLLQILSPPLEDFFGSLLILEHVED